MPRETTSLFLNHITENDISDILTLLALVYHKKSKKERLSRKKIWKEKEPAITQTLLCHFFDWLMRASNTANTFSCSSGGSASIRSANWELLTLYP